MFDIDKLVDKTGNRYVLTAIVAKRAKQLNEGAPPMVPIEGIHKPLYIALQEIEKKEGSIELVEES